MAYRNFLQLVSEVFRHLSAFSEKTEVWAVQQSLNDSLLEICQFHNWNFLIDRYDINLANSYGTGTVAVTQGSTAVTGTGTTWLTSWFNKKMLITGSNADKEVALFGSGTTATLRYPWGGASATGTYQIYQEDYPVPTQNGRDIMIVDPTRQRRLRKPDLYTLQDRTVWGRFFSAGVGPVYYSDGGSDVSPTSPTYNQARFKVWPPITTAQDLILWFYKTPTPMIQDTDTTVLPNEFEEILIRLTLYRIKKSAGLPGWMDDHIFAMQNLLQFREKQGTQSSYDYQVQSSWPFADSYAVDASLGGIWPGKLG